MLLSSFSLCQSCFVVNVPLALLPFKPLYIPLLECLFWYWWIGCITALKATGSNISCKRIAQSNRTVKLCFLHVIQWQIFLSAFLLGYIPLRCVKDESRDNNGTCIRVVAVRFTCTFRRWQDIRSYKITPTQIPEPTFQPTLPFKNLFPLYLPYTHYTWYINLPPPPPPPTAQQLNSNKI